jgi:hypothetical protein
MTADIPPSWLGEVGKDRDHGRESAGIRQRTTSCQPSRILEIKSPNDP